MKCVVYLSEANFEATTPNLLELAQRAAIKNKSLGVTGFLCFSRGRFLQYLEGEEEVLQNLLEEIREDMRHELMFELEPAIIEKPLFSSWAMRLITEQELDKFNFELQIEQNLLYIKNDYWFKERCDQYIWQHITQMAKLKKYLDIYS
ncbi:BLUF domain-containing protein [Glaciecola sp. SC05]|uniref:BLUF domain-containing protein n=1 Tax=Glaciecola sp. SC05 TaxID=1987355 RepID=UPI0035280B79